MLLAMIQGREDRDDDDIGKKGDCRRGVYEQLDSCGSSEVLTTASHVDAEKIGFWEIVHVAGVGGVLIWEWTDKSIALYGFYYWVAVMKPVYQLSMWEGKGCSRVKKK